MTDEELVQQVALEVMGKPLEALYTTRYEGWFPLTDWIDCGIVIDRMYNLGWHLMLQVGPGKCSAVFMRSAHAGVEIFRGYQPQRAICLAALRAVRCAR